MRTRSKQPGVTPTLRLELEPDEVRVDASPVDVSLLVHTDRARMTLSLTGEAAIELANQLTDAVDRLDGRD